MADTISYQYAALSALQRAADQDELFLAKYSEIEKKDAPCFFWGEVDTTLYDGTLPHCVIQCCAVQFQPDTGTTYNAERSDCNSWK